MAVLVIADHDNATLKDNTHKVVTAAQAIGGDVDILVAGANTAAIAADAAKMAADRKTQEWWSICMPMQAPLATRKEGEWWAEMENVFHVD